MASRLSAGRPPPVAGSSDVKAKLVGVDRAARETLDTHVEPGVHDPGLRSPGLWTASAVLMWQPRQNNWLFSGPRPSAAVCGVVKNLIPSRTACCSLVVASGYIRAGRSRCCSGKAPTTPNWFRGTRCTGRNTVPAGGTAMSKMPDCDGPASPARCTSKAGSPPTLDGGLTQACNARIPIAAESVSVATSVRMMSPLIAHDVAPDTVRNKPNCVSPSFPRGRMICHRNGKPHASGSVRRLPQTFPPVDEWFPSDTACRDC